MMDKFPEAFRRFEQYVDVSETTSFRELRLAFSFWAGKKWKDTPRQIEALGVEANRIGIPVERVPREPRRIVKVHYRVETITRHNKLIKIYRDIKTGRFVRHPR